MPLLKRAKAMLTLVVLGVVFTWVACSDPPPVAPTPAGKATCELCDFLDDYRSRVADGQGAVNEAEADSTESEDETDSTPSDSTLSDDETDGMPSDDETDSTSPEIVSFADSNLERAVRQKLKKPEGPLTADDLASLTRIDVEEQSIKSLAGLEYATALDTLNLWGNEIEDVSPLSDLTNLTFLKLGDNQVADVSPLSSLTNLKWLSLWGNEVADVSALSSLTKLNTLNLWGNEVADVSALSSLTKLRWLNLGNNQVADVSALDGLTNLDWLGLVDNPISQRKVNQQVPTLIEKDVSISVVLPESETCASAEGALVYTSTPLVMPAVSGGTGEITYSVSGLPPGLSFNSATRTITGTPEGSCGITYTATYTATDEARATKSRSFTMVIRR